MVTAFFMHEFVEPSYPEIDNARLEWSASKSERTQHLNAIKENSKGTAEYNAYWQSKVKTDLLHEKLQIAKEKNKFFGFQNYQQFLGEFGWAFGLLLISLYMILKDLSRNSKTTIYEMLINGSVLTISLFFIFWALGPKQDFPKLTYVISSIFISILSCVGLYFLVKHKNLAVTRLKLSLRKVFDFIIIDAPSYVDETKQKDYDNKVDNVINDVSEQF